MDSHYDAIREAIHAIRTADDIPLGDPPAPSRWIMEPEHPVEVDDLPRGPKAVANKVAGGWHAWWYRTVVQDDDHPAQSGESFGVRFVHEDGRWGWATWLYGKFHAARVYHPQVGRLPTMLSAKELKELLAE